MSRSDDGRYLDSIAFFQPDEKDALYTRRRAARARRRQAAPRIALARHFERFAALPPHSRMMRFDFETYLPEDVLTKVDRMSMAHSIESRVPLLDNEVIDFAATLPASLKIANGRRKHILKEAARRLLPAGDPRSEEAGIRRAARRVVPRRADGRVLRRARGRRRRGSAAISSRRSSTASSTEHLAGKRDHTLRLWQLLVFELWHRQYLDTPVSPAWRA